MRHTKIVVITAPGRDQGKQFLLTEMSADQGEKWALRALLALSNAGAEVPQEIIGSGMAGLAAFVAASSGVKLSETASTPLLASFGVFSIGALAKLKAESILPLLDEMFACIQMMPDPKRPDVVRPLIGNDDIEEVSTRIKLREELFILHTGFSLADMLSTFLAGMAAKNESKEPTSQESSPQSLPLN